MYRNSKLVNHINNSIKSMKLSVIKPNVRFISFLPRLRTMSLKKAINENINNYYAQSEYFKRLNDIGAYRLVYSEILRLKSPLSDESINKEFIRALCKTGDIYLTDLRINKDKVNVRGTKTNPLYSIESNKQSHFLEILGCLMFIGFAYVINYKTVNRESNSTSSIKSHEGETAKFSDIEGLDDIKEEMTFLLKYLKNPKSVYESGATIPHGVLLSGPPGCGKTLLARALAGEANVTFLYATASEFDEMYVGVGAKRIRKLFQLAKEHSPAIIFIDELDSVGGKRNSNGTKSYDRMTINQLLTEMGGFRESDGILVIAATNLKEILDPALIRPGRFDLQLEIPLPDKEGRLKIIERYCRNKRISEDVNLKELADTTPGATGADLENIINQAALLAYINKSKEIRMEDILKAEDKILLGTERKSAIIPKNVIDNTAYHEAGHALLATYFPGAQPVRSATIIPRGSALGLVSHLPSEESSYQVSKKELYAQIVVNMGGRVAEEIIFGRDNVTTGAGSDLEHAKEIARRMVMSYGMNNVHGYEVITSDNLELLSNESKHEIDKEVNKILNSGYNDAKIMISKNKSKLKRLAKSLKEREKLTGEEVRMILEGK